MLHINTLQRGRIFLLPDWSKVELYDVNSETERREVPFFLCNFQAQQAELVYGGLFLALTLKELNIIIRLDGRKTRNSELFKKD